MPIEMFNFQLHILRLFKVAENAFPDIVLQHYRQGRISFYKFRGTRIWTAHMPVQPLQNHGAGKPRRAYNPELKLTMRSVCSSIGETANSFSTFHISINTERPRNTFGE
jgi:hypothetical protein